MLTRVDPSIYRLSEKYRIATELSIYRQNYRKNIKIFYINLEEI